jgi:seryl-tRNA synthetase
LQDRDVNAIGALTMHDIKMIRENPAAFDAGLARRGVANAAGNILTLDAQKRMAIQETEIFQGRRKVLSQTFGMLKSQGKDIPRELTAELESLKNSIPGGEAQMTTLDRQLADVLASLPNIPVADVPDGADETGNALVHERGTKRTFDFTPREHFDFGPALGLDFESAQNVSGARFAYLRGPIARLNRALGQFMLDVHTTEFGYEEVAPPLLVRDHAMFGTGQLPKFTKDQFTAADQDGRDRLLADALENFDEAMQSAALSGRSYRQALDDLIVTAPTKEQFWLIPTAEVSLTNLVRERILEDNELPIRVVALTPCFRSEAGAAGRDTRGLIRQHQFDKVELVSIVTPDAADAEHERMTQAAEAILDRLELPYRRMLLCAGDMGFTAKKTYDLEVWLPGQNAYREISSCSNCGDFQARRMNARFRKSGEKGTIFLHTLNGSGVAVGRALVAVLENYQQTDGSVAVPDALIPYMGGVTTLTP